MAMILKEGRKALLDEMHSVYQNPTYDPAMALLDLHERHGPKGRETIIEYSCNSELCS